MKRIIPSNRQVIIFLHVLFWATMLILPLLYATFTAPYARIGIIPVSFFVFSWIIFIGQFYFTASYLYPKFLNKKYWWLYIICMMVLFAGINHLKVIILGRWFPHLNIYGRIAPFIFAPTFLSLLIGTIYRFIINRIRAEKRQKENEAEKLTMELKFLRSQVNPHFLFNVLTSLVSLARKKSDRLESSLIILSDMMRYMLYDSSDKKVRLDSEVTYLKSYIALQQLRFEDSILIQSNFELTRKSKQSLIEPMLLIPFVENAFKHGTGWMLDPYIRILLHAEEGKLNFEVENKLSKDDTKHDLGQGIGLSNVKSRLNLLYPNSHELVISTGLDTFNVHLTIQLQ